MNEKWLIEILMATIGTIAFSSHFGVTRNHYPLCGLNGGFAYIVLSSCVYFGITRPVATFISAVGLTVMSRILAARSRAPTTIFLYTGIFVLVPGSGIYGIACSLFLETVPPNIMSASQTIKIAVAIAIGIGVAYMIPAKLLGWGRDNSGPPTGRKIR